MKKTTNNFVFYLLLFIAMIFWGASWVNAKILGDFISARELIVYRYGISVLTLIPVIFFLKLSYKINLKNLLIAFISSVFIICYSILMFNGVKYGTAGLGGAFVTTVAPILTFILSVLFIHRFFRKRDILALILGVLGILLILNIFTLTLNDIFVKSNLYFILASLAWSIMTLNNTRFKDIHPLVFTLYLYICVFVLGIFITDFDSGNIFEFNASFWINLLVVSIAGTTFATSTYLIAITKFGASRASSFIFLVPFNAIFLSYLFLDEPIYISAMFGTVLTIIAVSILNNISWISFKKK